MGLLHLMQLWPICPQGGLAPVFTNGKWRRSPDATMISRNKVHYWPV